MQKICGAVRNTTKNITDIPILIIESTFDIFSFFLGTEGKLSKLLVVSILISLW